VNRQLGQAILDRAENARTTGVWWEPEWWRIPGALPDEVSIAQFDAAVATLRTVFDARWFLETTQPHSAKFVMHDAGNVAIYETIFLAEQLRALRAAEGEHESVVARLRHPNEYRGACREMFACWLLAGSQLRYRLVPNESNGTNDLATVGASPDFAIEVTGISQRDADLRVADLVRAATQVVGEHLGPRGSDLWLDGEAVVAFRDDGEPSKAARILEAVRAAATAAQGLTVGAEVMMSGVGRLQMRAGTDGAVHGPPLDLNSIGEFLDHTNRAT
jgi:hypothetical protein